jgi:hypothetical protein
MRDDQKNLPIVDVPVAGFNQPVTVFVSHDFAEFPHGLTVLAPDTRHVKALATIEQGANVYGSLSEQFFVCRDGDSDYNWTVLWVTLNAHQAEDSVPRLEPFCMLAARWLPDDIEDDTSTVLEEFAPLELEGMTLLWAYANYVTGTWGKEFLAEARVLDGALKAGVADSIVRAGVSGIPLDFSRF